MKLLRIYALAVALLPLLVTAQPEWLNDGLVAYYPFDGDAKDYSGNGNHGILRPGTTITESGEMLIDGSHEGIGFGSEFEYPSITYSLFYTPTKFFEDSEQWMSVLIRPEGRVHPLVFDSKSMTFGALNFESPAWVRNFGFYNAIKSFEWDKVLYLTVVLSTKYELFLNGELLFVSEDFTNNINYPLNGISMFNRSQAAQGYIDDVRIYNRSLSAPEVAELYAYETTGSIDDWVGDGLVAFYPFEGDAKDYSGNGNDGTIHGVQFSQNSNGNPGLSAYFDGVDDYIEVLDNESLRFADSSFSISVWFEVQISQDKNGFGAMVAKRGSGSRQGYIFGLDFGYLEKDFAPALQISGGENPYVIAREAATDGWHHLAVTYNHKDYETYFYLDAKPIPSEPLRGTMLPPLGVHDNLRIGVDSESNKKYWFSGNLDNIRLYNRALSAYEVSQLRAYEPDFSRGRAVATLVAGFVVGADIVSPGIGFYNQPEIKFVGGNPVEEAQAEAVIENGRLVGINITNAGSGYQEVPSIRIESPPSQAQLGIEISRIETTVPDSERPRRAIATANVINGFLVSADLVDGGLGYVQAPIVTVVDDTGTGALAAATIENGVVTSVQFVKAGIGYSDKALIQFQSPPPNPDATPRVTEVELSMQLRFPNNYYVIEASSDLVNWEQVVEPFFAEETTHTVKVTVGDDDIRYFRAIQLP